MRELISQNLRKAKQEQLGSSKKSMMDNDTRILKLIKDVPIDKLALEDKVHLYLQTAEIKTVGDILRMSDTEFQEILNGESPALDNIKKCLQTLVQESLFNSARETLNSSNILINQEKCLDSQNEEKESTDIKEDKESEKEKEFLDASILVLDANVKLFYALRLSELNTIRDIVFYKRDDITKQYRRLKNVNLDELSDVISSLAEKMNCSNHLGKYPFFENPEMESKESFIVDEYSLQEEVSTTPHSSDEAGENDEFNKPVNLNNDTGLSLEECIKNILAERKKSGKDWITALHVYDALRESYPSLAGEIQLVDVREVLTNSECIEKEDYFYRIKDAANVNSFLSNYPKGTDEKRHDEPELEVVSSGAHSTGKIATNLRDDQILEILTEDNNKERELLETIGGLSQEDYSRILDYPIDALDLSVRARNCLRRGGIITVGGLLSSKPSVLMGLPSFGRKSQIEIIGIIREFLKDIRDCHFPVVNSDSTELEGKRETSKKSVVKGRLIRDIPIGELGLSVRANRCLLRNNITMLSQAMALTMDDLLSIRNMGKMTAKEIADKIQNLVNKGEILIDDSDEEAQELKRDYYESDEFKKQVKTEVSNILFRQEFNGLTLDEIADRITIIAEKDVISVAAQTAIIELFSEQIVQCKNGKYYYVYPSIYDVLTNYPDNHQRIIKLRLEGKTLEEIAKAEGLTRERIRQIVVQVLKTIKQGKKGQKPIRVLYEDKYRYLYQNYHIAKTDWSDIIKQPEYIFNYLQVAYSRGGRPLVLALEDGKVDEDIKKRIRSKDDENYIVIENRRIPKKIREIEDYVIHAYFKDEATVEEFFNTYNRFLDENHVEEENLYVTETTKRTRENRIADSRKVLWKQNRRLRYYDIDGTDFQELLDTINLKHFENTSISTLKFMRDYPELMKEYDIRDEYELHNLLKKICNPLDYNDIKFGRMPGIVFGNFKREDAVREMLFSLAPINQNDLAEAISEKYGFQVQSITANWLGSIDEYYINGEYQIEDENSLLLTDEQLHELEGRLYDNFYFMDEVTRIYSDIVGHKESPKVYVLKRLGFRVFSDYIIKGAYTATEFFRNILTREDMIDLSTYGPRLRYLAAFNQVEYALRDEYVILEYEPYKYINISRLSSFGIDKSDIVSYCNEVKKFVGDNTYFTIAWLRNQSFESKLDDLGFEDFFYEMILSMDPGIFGSINRSDNRKGSSLLKVGSEMGTKSDFIVRLINSEGSIDKDTLIKYCKDYYNVVVTDNSIYHAVDDSDVYYDSIMEKYYANYSLYFEEI